MGLLKKFILLQLLILASNLAWGDSAYIKALKQSPSGKSLEVESLLIGCTNHPDVQKTLHVYYPPGPHLHRRDEWVSFDLDHKMKADISASVDDLELYVSKIKKQVYIEHFNDDQDRKDPAYTRLYDLPRKLFKLMDGGATLYLDLHLRFFFYMDNREPLYFTQKNSTAGPQFGIDPKMNPFWAVFSFNHFREAMTPENPNYDVLGRMSVIRYIGDFFTKQVGSPWPFTGATLLNKSKEYLDLLLNSPNVGQNPGLLEIFMKAYYLSKAEAGIVQYLKDLGYVDVQVTTPNPNPFNGRKLEKLIEAKKPIESQTTQLPAAAALSPSAIEGPEKP